MTTQTLVQLKSIAYDALVQVEAWQRTLKEANEAIVNYKKPEGLSKEKKIV